MRWMRRPVIRFVAVGIACFAASRWWSPNAGTLAPRGEVVISAAQIAQLQAEYVRDTGLPLSPAATAALVQRAIDDELLYREALRRGLHLDDRSIEWQLAERMQFLAGTDDDPMGAERTHLARAAFEIGLDQGDAIIRRMLVEKMRLLAAHHAVPAAAPADADIEAYLREHADAYRQPERYTFWHVFLRRDDRPATVERDAAALLDTLRQTDAAPADAARRGDAFAVGAYVVAQPAERLRATFGPAFAAALGESVAGRWLGPLASPYGLHLVWLQERAAGQLPPLDQVRSRIIRRLRAEHRTAAVREFTARLGHLYTVRVEAVPGGLS